MVREHRRTWATQPVSRFGPDLRSPGRLGQALSLFRFRSDRIALHSLRPSISHPRVHRGQYPSHRHKQLARWVLYLVLSAVCSLDSRLFAQITSDQVPQERIVPLREQLLDELSQSRFKLGPFRVQPRFTIRNAGYDSNVLNVADQPRSDWTATIGAGASFLLPMGRKLYGRGELSSEYSWYAELDQQRNLGYVAAGSVLGLMNRMSFELGARSLESVRTVSSEIDVPAVQNLDESLAKVDVQIRPRVAMFASWNAQEQRFRAADLPPPAGDLRSLDRQESAYRFGARYSYREGIDVSGAIEESVTDFQREGDRRDNETTAYLLGVRYDRPRLFVNASAGRREIRPATQSAFAEDSQVTGSYFASYHFARPVHLQVFGQRGFIYGLFEQAPYFVERRNGLGSVVEAGRRLRVRVFVEKGNNEYPLSVSGDEIGRNDEVLTIGSGLSVRVLRESSLGIFITRSDYDSNVSGLDRSVLRITSTFTLKGDAF